MQNGMEVVSFRVPKELKEQMKDIDTNWSEKVRKLIEDTVNMQKKKRALEMARKLLEGTPSAPSGTAAKYIREDRDSN